LEILSDLLESYEEKNLRPFRGFSVQEILRFLLEENRLTGEDLAKLLKVDRSVAYKICSGSFPALPNRRLISQERGRSPMKTFFPQVRATF